VNAFAVFEAEEQRGAIIFTACNKSKLSFVTTLIINTPDLSDDEWRDPRVRGFSCQYISN